jgi:hypothetical protein
VRIGKVMRVMAVANEGVRCTPSGRDEEHKWASGDDDAMAIVASLSSPRLCCACEVGGW